MSGVEQNKPTGLTRTQRIKYPTDLPQNSYTKMLSGKKKQKASATKQTRSRATRNQKRNTKCMPSETKASDKEEDHHRNKRCRLTSFGSDIEEVELIGGESKENEGDMENVGSEAGVSVIYFAAKENMADEIN